ncbi:MAG: hypothetical protein PHE83_07820 [Opitutaceae bacterium]|nr:hypothetical protein [Opitutaceae bacterium]
MIFFSTLLAAGTVLQPVKSWVIRAEGMPRAAVRADNFSAIAGQGISVALLGGFRALAADLLWLQTYRVWTEENLPATQALVRLVTLADERPLCFWLHGARMIAYDMAQWRLADDGRGAPAEARRRISEEQAAAALQRLEEARHHHPHRAAICVEMANIHLYARKDLAAAARWYREAAEAPDAPYYAGRIYAELLKRQGRYPEAYVWLRNLHPGLPADDEQAMSGVVLARIRELERYLEVAEKERYAAPMIDAKAPRP